MDYERFKEASLAAESAVKNISDAAFYIREPEKAPRHTDLKAWAIPYGCIVESAKEWSTVRCLATEFRDVTASVSDGIVSYNGVIPNTYASVHELVADLIFQLYMVFLHPLVGFEGDKQQCEDLIGALVGSHAEMLQVDRATLVARLCRERAKLLPKPDRMADTTVSETTTRRRKTGRRPKEFTSSEYALIHTLSRLHRYDPATGRVEQSDLGLTLTEIADAARISKSQASKVFKAKFGSFDNYRSLCDDDTIGIRLRKLLGHFDLEDIQQTLKELDIEQYSDELKRRGFRHGREPGSKNIYEDD